MVVTDWGPQIEILGHPSTGGFISHCGWHSCLESITMRVPIAAWPMHSDQPKNAFLVTDILKIGVVVNRWEHREELLTSSTIAEAVKRLMASEEGEELRKRSKELGASQATTNQLTATLLLQSPPIKSQSTIFTHHLQTPG
ncbi:zeatin O-xylosyltransferase-like [Actinidia eriantha]|uniref:zeatin O-xylosyltransferase-like n=1 Tax=Actinidia eriantha TaxID=165200 RepID=UPI0025898CAD|nr:zeatin O-xylosyltransferase-like [Actinidia eriantha]